MSDKLNKYDSEEQYSVPFVLRDEFESFANHYNDNQEKALETVKDNHFLIGRLLERVVGLRKREILFLIWNMVLTVAVGILVWVVFL